MLLIYILMTVTMRDKLIARAIVLSLFLATYVAAQENNVGSQKAYAQGELIKQYLTQLQQLAKQGRPS